MENVFKPLFITCFDSNNKFVLLINPEVNKISQLKKIFAKLLEKNQEYDIIWTNDIESYCFVEFPSVRFKSFKDQKAYYQNIADEWMASQSKPIPEPVKVEQKLPF
jgi:hypothetical protein